MDRSEEGCPFIRVLSKQELVPAILETYPESGPAQKNRNIHIGFPSKTPVDHEFHGIVQG